MHRIITDRNHRRVRFWDEPLHDWSHRVHVGKVALNWLAGALLSMLAALLIVLAASPFTDVTTPATGTTASIWIVAGGFGSILGFFTASVLILRTVPSDRLLHAIAVAATHVLVIGLVLLTNLVLQWTAGANMFDALPSASLIAEAGIGFFLLERSAATSIAGCLLAAATMPSGGPVPRKTQVGEPDDRSTL